MHYGSVCGRALAAAAIVGLCASFSDVVTAAPLYEKSPRPVEGCPEVFSPILCRDFDFVFQSERAARFEQDRLIVRPTSAQLVIDACTLAALIRETEALPNSRFIELRFERITIRGMLHLSEIDPRARLSFFDVTFVPAPLMNDADTVGEIRSESTILEAGVVQPVASIDGAGTDIASVARDGPMEPLECLDSEPVEPAFAGASVVIERSRFRDRVRFERALFEGSVIASGSVFQSNFDIIDSDIGGDLVLESSEFASNLELGRNTILRGQTVVDGVRVGGDMDINGIEVIDTYLDLQESEGLTVAPDTTLALAPACVCAHRDGTFNVDLDRINPDAEAIAAPPGPSRYVDVIVAWLRRTPVSEIADEPSVREIVEATSCKRLPNLPRCPRSNGSSPLLIEISRTDVAGLLNLTSLRLGSARDGFHPPKSSGVVCLHERDECSRLSRTGSRRPERRESSLSRLGNANVLFHDVSVAGAALLQENQSNAFYINNSSIQRLTSERNEFNYLIVGRNEFGAFNSLKDTFYRMLAVTRNKVAGSMELDSLVLSDEVFRQQEEPRKLSVTVTHNLVGRDLVFTPSGVTEGVIDEVDLSTNRVGGEFAISLPVTAASAPTATDEETQQQLAWNGSISLESLAVDGTLAVGFASASKSGRMIVDTEGELSETGVSCERKGGSATVHLNLANTMAKNLLWAVPVPKPGDNAAECVSWEGVGLRYDSWDVPRRSESLQDLLGQWRALYARDGRGTRGLLLPMIGSNDVPPDPLHHMADYLGKIGEQKESREVKAEAKRAGFPVPAEGPAATLGNVVARIVFLPTDFGTKPERAFIVLAFFSFAAWWIYRRCWSRHSRDWPNVQKRRDALVMRDQIHESMLQHLAGRDLDDPRNGKDPLADGRGLNRVLNRYAPMPDVDSSMPDLSEGELRHISAVPGFMQYDRNRQPQYFNLVLYAIDTMIPVIDLHAYNQYYPIQGWVRSFAMCQHVVGWWVLTSFLASLAVF